MVRLLIRLVLLPSVAYLNGNRSSPDIAMSADPLNGWTFMYNSKLYVNAIAGTSASSPSWASLLARMNLKYPTNFCTTMYSIYTPTSNAFKAITLGTNDNISANGGVYAANKSGPNQCTGLGTPNGVNLLAALKLAHV